MGIQYIQMFFMLGIIDDFVDFWCQYIYGCYGFVIFVKVYVKCFNFFWIVFYYYWCFEMFFCQIMFVFGREVDVLEYWVFKCFIIVFQNGDCFGVIYLSEVGRDKMFQMSDSVFIYVFGKEFYVICMFFQNCVEDIFQYGFCQMGVVFQIGECYFWFQYLEFCQVVVGVGIFCVEGWFKSIDFGQCVGIGFIVELVGDGQE